MSYRNYGKRTKNTFTPQNEPIPNKGMVANNAGGFAFEVSDLEKLKRFAILGTVGGTYYVDEHTLTKEHLVNVENLLKAGQYKLVVDTCVDISVNGRAMSEDPILFVLARVFACDVFGKVKKERKPVHIHKFHRQHHEDLFEKMPIEGKVYTFKHPETTTYVRTGDEIVRTERTKGGFYTEDDPRDIEARRYALEAFTKIVRMGTQWLHFFSYVQQFRGNGSIVKKAAEKWFAERKIERVAFHAAKYQNRDNWTQRDTLRLTHVKAESDDRNLLFKWITKKEMTGITEDSALRIIYGTEAINKATDHKEAEKLIREYQLTREMVPTPFLKKIGVWEALLPHMAPEAMMKNLATMTRNGVLTDHGSFTTFVMHKLLDKDALAKARIHPVKVLNALKAYELGKSEYGNGEWTPIRQIVDALNESFFLSFQYAEPTGKKLLLAIDVSGSMYHKSIVVGKKKNKYGYDEVKHGNFTVHEGAATMALATANAEWQEKNGLRTPNYETILFDEKTYKFHLGPRTTVKEALDEIRRYGGGGTDCSLPMKYALDNKIPDIDAFVIYTDNESWHDSKYSYASRYGYGHPSELLAEYRRKYNNQAKIVSVQMAPNAFTNNDPDDSLALDCIGFDTNTPNCLSAFVQ